MISQERQCGRDSLAAVLAGKSHQFEMQVEDKTFTFQRCERPVAVFLLLTRYVYSESEASIVEWIRAIRETVKRLRERVRLQSEASASPTHTRLCPGRR
jgi:hypothetical protein